MTLTHSESFYCVNDEDLYLSQWSLIAIDYIGYEWREEEQMKRILNTHYKFIKEEEIIYLSVMQAKGMN